MPKYSVDIAFDVSYYAEVEIEAADEAELIKILTSDYDLGEAYLVAEDRPDLGFENRRVVEVRDEEGESVLHGLPMDEKP